MLAAGKIAHLNREQLPRIARVLRIERRFLPRAVVDANLAIIAEAYDGLIDVTGAIGAGLVATAEGADR